MCDQCHRHRMGDSDEWVAEAARSFDSAVGLIIILTILFAFIARLLMG